MDIFQMQSQITWKFWHYVAFGTNLIIWHIVHFQEICWNLGRDDRALYQSSWARAEACVRGNNIWHELN